LLGERARLLRLGRHGRISANGSCRLLTARGGTVALNLAWPDDSDLMPALLGEADRASLDPLHGTERRAAQWGGDTADIQAWLDSPSSG